MMEISDFFPKDGHVQRIYCENCGGYLDLRFFEFQQELTGIMIYVNGLPELYCDKCGASYLPERSRHAILWLHEQATLKGSRIAKSTRNKPNKNYGFTEVSFSYDSDDYENIPGLWRSHNEGYLTPIYFNKTVLLKYDSSPTYRLSFASTTYGEIRRGDDYSIPFGINKRGKLIMWLGDVAQLPKSEQFYLLSENIESDHSIGSEFYDGQIECKFTECSKENSLFKARSIFLESCFKRFDVKFAFLDDEVLELAIKLRCPIVDSAKEERYVADALNKVYIESFNKEKLAEVLRSLNIDYTNLGSIRMLQKIIEGIADGENIPKIMTPFYVLYDLRVAYSHLGSKAGTERRLESVKERLEIESDAQLDKIYYAIVDQLLSAFDKLSTIVAGSTQ